MMAAQNECNDRDQVIGDTDCLIVGGGPAGLTAAIYLARFLRRCIVIDAGEGRAASIAKSHNFPGFPGGISGVDLLRRMSNQARRFGAILRSGTVASIVPAGDRFVVTLPGGNIQARAILIATGVVNHRPKMSSEEHDVGVARGLIRYCPVCDGYEATGMQIAVLGCDGHGAAEAEFLRSYSDRITLLAQASIDLPASDHARLVKLGIKICDSPVRTLRIDQHQVVADLLDGHALKFDTLYPALGTSPTSKLATAAGVTVSEAGCILTDDHQQTSIPGIYAAGDVVEGLDQMSVATGGAAKAATSIHNHLRDKDEDAAPGKNMAIS